MGRCGFPQLRSFSGEGGQTGPAQRGAVRPAWLAVQPPPPPRILGRVVFEVVSRVVSVLEVVVQVVGLESLQVARRSPTRAQHGDRRSRSFEIERRDGPRYPFRGFGPSPVREGWFPRSGFRGGIRGGSFGRKDVLDCANPAFEQMARHWFYSFGTNPSAESFGRSCACF
jgi:hypothetical protein